MFPIYILCTYSFKDGAISKGLQRYKRNFSEEIP